MEERKSENSTKVEGGGVLLPDGGMATAPFDERQSPFVVEPTDQTAQLWMGNGATSSMDVGNLGDMQHFSPPPPVVTTSSSNTPANAAASTTQPPPIAATSMPNGKHHHYESDNHSLGGASTFSSYIGGATSPNNLVVSPPPSEMGATPSRNGGTVINPLASEAEQLILRAMEQQQQQNNCRSRAGTADMAPFVPSNNNAATTTTTDFLPSASLVHRKTNNSGTHGVVTDGNESLKSHGTTGTKTTTAGHKRMGSAGSVKSQQSTTKPPLVPNRDPAATYGIKTTTTATTTTIKKNLTTEQTLAELTMVLEAIHDHQHHHPEAVAAADPAVSTSTDAFCHNANIVFQGPRNNRRQSTVANSMMSSGSSGMPPPLRASTTIQSSPPPPASSSTSSAQHNWGKLRDVVRTTSVGTQPSSHPVDTEGTNTMQNYPHDTDLECTGVPSITITEAAAPTTSQTAGTTSNNKPGRKSNKMSSAMVGSKGAVQDLQLFMEQRRRVFSVYIYFLLFVMIPATAVSVILFYFAGNPPTGRVDVENSTSDVWVDENGNLMNTSKASASWWILFICVRQALTFSLAHLWQVFIIDFLCLNTTLFQSILGNLLTLLIVQSRGWPFIAVTWGILDFGLLHGSSRFASSWLFWQDVMDVFNDANPGGSITSNVWNTRVLSVAVSVGIVVSIKRLWLGLFLGKKTYMNHADDLQKVYRKVVLLCEVAALARDLQLYPSFRRRPTIMFGMNEDEFDGVLRRTAETNDVPDEPQKQPGPSFKAHEFEYHKETLIDRSDSDPAQLNASERRNMLELLGAWEEPEAETEAEENVSISAILLFQNLVTIFDKAYMFSIAWGDVSTRDLMITNSEKVFQRLVLGSSDPTVLKFDVLARLARQPNGCLDHDKLSDLIRLLRPGRDGNLQLIEFIKSVDSVYKEAKLLRASIRNSGKIDSAFEKSINVVFYTVVVCIILSQIGINPYSLFLSLSPLVLAFAFMIGSAASKMFEGWLFILIRRPFNIGDLIHISNSEQETESSGSAGWIVKDVTLFHTTAVFSSTGETATLSNGSLAGSRIINMARSPHASISINFKFSTREPFERIQIFDNVLREFIKARPREWSKFSGFRVSSVRADLGYVEYVVLLTHREAWQNIGAIMESKATVASFCLELSKKLDMRYQSPPLPVDLAFVNRSGNAATENEALVSKAFPFDGDDTTALKELAALYAKNK